MSSEPTRRIHRFDPSLTTLVHDEITYDADERGVVEVPLSVAEQLVSFPDWAYDDGTWDYATPGQSAPDASASFSHTEQVQRDNDTLREAHGVAETARVEAEARAADAEAERDAAIARIIQLEEAAAAAAAEQTDDAGAEAASEPGDAAEGEPGDAAQGDDASSAPQGEQDAPVKQRSRRKAKDA